MALWVQLHLTGWPMWPVFFVLCNCARVLTHHHQIQKPVVYVRMPCIMHLSQCIPFPLKLNTRLYLPSSDMEWTLSCPPMNPSRHSHPGRCCVHRPAQLEVLIVQNNAKHIVLAASWNTKSANTNNTHKGTSLVHMIYGTELTAALDRCTQLPISRRIKLRQFQLLLKQKGE